jgi:hypothetical protein
VFRYQPLWPFASEHEVATWQQAYRSGGKQPWHLDAGQTALFFTTGFVGFGEVDTIVSRSVLGDDATVAMGYRADSATASVAAVVHLRRMGQGDDAPWEVVGTRDSTFTLDRPRYGAAATSPLVVGGRITGVDESIRVDVRAEGERPLMPQSGKAPRSHSGLLAVDPGISTSRHGCRTRTDEHLNTTGARPPRDRNER